VAAAALDWFVKVAAGWEGDRSSPSSKRSDVDRYARKLHAIAVRKAGTGTPSSSAMPEAHGIKPSATMHVAAGNPPIASTARRGAY
jgi:hypothetical protein